MPTNDLNTTKDDEVDKIVLIDGNALIHRSYHAIPHLTTGEGKLVNAVYGFAATILRVLEDLKPRYIVATFDVSKDTFRRKLYSEYKAQRVAAPQELYDQIPMVKEICDVLNIPIFAVEGFEADDVIGTIVNKLKTKNLKLKTNDVILNDSEESQDPSQAQDDIQPKKLMPNKLKAFIVTGDKDTYQLVSNDVFVYSIIKGLKNVEIIDTFYVREKYGFGPELIIDYKALRGDPSDNIPGVPGIGEVTAKKLIVEFGTIENLYSVLSSHPEQQRRISLNRDSSSACHSGEDQNLDQKGFRTSRNDTTHKLSDKIKKLLLANKEQALLSKVLSTIKLDVPLDFDLGCCLVHDYDKEKALKLFKKLEFKSLISRLPEQHSRHEQVKLF
ncbi:MAG: hypothetical protein ACD_58C00322G0005 [uncultured bacterium]|nr:MAG: hypothetical protein ACD_58C00322G0005 [uncultured bacterium]